MPYRVEISPAAMRDLKRMNPDAARRLRDAIDGLAHDPRPHGCKKLAGDDHGWRVRVGDYRILYEIHDRRLVVMVFRAAHRKDVYR